MVRNRDYVEMAQSAQEWRLMRLRGPEIEYKRGYPDYRTARRNASTGKIWASFLEILRSSAPMTHHPIRIASAIGCYWTSSISLA